ncbi:PepSY domain-containing protein [Nitrosomonas europaea]|uniref:PepSY domain-containing protein n=1 Tax=Nitrosomonas europaea TaxID=915 RepID=UPI0032661959
MSRWQQALLIMSIMVAAMPDTLARRHDAASGHDRAGKPAGGISEQRAIAIAQQHFSGRVLAISQTDRIYRIKILSDQGTVHTILIDALNGAVVSAR